MVERRFAVLVFRHVFARYNRNVHYAPTAGFANKRRLLRPVPKPTIVNRQIARVYIEADFMFIGLVIHEILFAEQHFEDTLLVGTRNNAQATVFVRSWVQVNTNIEHRHDALTQENVAGAVGMPAHLRELTVRRTNVVVQNKAVFFDFSNASFVGLE